MLYKSRASRTVDVQRMGQAVARPGMDTRRWMCEAIVEKFKLDDEGAFADVVILPELEPETVRVGPFYAGPGFGFYAPLEKDDHVIISFPDGDPDRGGVVVARMWSKSDPPPDLAKNNDGDVCLVVKKDANLRIRTFGSGNIVVGIENGKVLLGDETGTKKVARVDDHANVGTLLFSTAGPGVLTGTYTDPDGVATPFSLGASFPLKAKINEGSDKVESA